MEEHHVSDHESDDISHLYCVYQDAGIGESLFLDPLIRCGGLYPVIMRLNKRIHSEAAPVLWGENYFTWVMQGHEQRRLWHVEGHGKRSSKTRITRRYGRLIKQIRLNVYSTSFDKFHFLHRSWTAANFRSAVQKLCLCELRYFEITFFHQVLLIGSHHTSGLEYLKMLRSRKVCIHAPRRLTRYALLLITFQDQLKRLCPRSLREGRIGTNEGCD